MIRVRVEQLENTLGIKGCTDALTELAPGAYERNLPCHASAVPSANMKRTRMSLQVLSRNRAPNHQVL